MYATLFALSSTACDAPPRQRLAPLPAEAVILAFGDSLTSGVGSGGFTATDTTLTYPAQLAKRIGRKVINAGIPGETSTQGLLRLPALLQKHSPSLVILCHGGNDLLRRLSRSSLISNLEIMIQACRESGAEVVMLTVPSPGAFVSPDELYGDLAKRLDIPLEDTVLSEVLSDSALKSDYIHPNAKGYAAVADALHNLLIREGAVAPR